MEKIIKYLLYEVIEYLNVHDFLKFYKSSKSVMFKLQDQKLLKTPFIVISSYQNWSEKFTKVLPGHFKRKYDMIVDPQFNNKYIWKNQEFIRFFLKTRKIKDDFEINVIPFHFKDAFSVRKNSLSLSKYAKLLIETNDSEYLQKYLRLKYYLTKFDRVMQDYENELISKRN